MRTLRPAKRLFPILLIVILTVALSVTAFAAAEDFYFQLSNTGTTVQVYTGSSNIKTVQTNPASIGLANTDAPGYGMLLHLVYWDGSRYTQATTSGWYNPNHFIDTEDYLSGCAVCGRYYYIAGRIDNDYYGTYTTSGRYNADIIKLFANGNNQDWIM